jgi:hypothetical protein
MIRRLVLLGTLAVLLAAGAWIVQSQRATWTSSDARIGQKLLAGLKLEDVAEVVVQEPKATLTLVRRDGAWRVHQRADFPADPDRVRELLLKLIELKIVQAETVTESQRARLLLLEPGAEIGAGVLFELKNSGGTQLARLLLGKAATMRFADAAPAPEAGVPSGRYVMSGGEVAGAVLVSDPLAQAKAQPEAWLAKELIRVERVKSISTAGHDGRQRFSVARDTEVSEWKLAGGGKPDGGKVQDAVSALLTMSLADVVADPAKADSGLDHPMLVKAQTFDDVVYTLKIGAKVAGERYYLALSVAGEPPKARVPAASESNEEKEKQDRSFGEHRAKLLEKLDREKTLERWTYLVSAASLEPLLRERVKFLPEKAAK